MDCIKCKGSKMACGKSFCPIYAKTQSMFKINPLVKQDFLGSSPGVFVGRYGYPKVNVGILSPPQQIDRAWIHDAPHYWGDHNLQIPEIIDLRSALINSRFTSNIKKPDRFLDISREIAMSNKPVDLEINLEKKPSVRLNFEPNTAPYGPAGNLQKVSITSNPKISKKVDKAVSDTDLKAEKAIIYLYENNHDDNFLTKLLSVGSLGIGKNRKLVPTRWSISAVYDIIGKHLTEIIKKNRHMDYSVSFGSYLGNYFLILGFPEPWSYELFEMYLPNASWNTSSELQYTTDHEFYKGRKYYAENCAGGYYAARLSILERLRTIKKQGTVLALRFITGEYAAPLGVWVVAEAVKKSMQNPLSFKDQKLMLKYAEELIKKKFNFDISNILEKSIILKELKHQKKLNEF